MIAFLVVGFLVKSRVRGGGESKGVRVGELSFADRSERRDLDVKGRVGSSRLEERAPKVTQRTAGDWEPRLRMLEEL